MDEEGENEDEEELAVHVPCSLSGMHVAWHLVGGLVAAGASALLARDADR